MDLPLYRLLAYKDELLERNAEHKRGFRIKDRPVEHTLLHLIEEMTEVGRATTLEDATQEFGDVLGLLFCYAGKVGIDVDEAAKSALEKLQEDFKCDHRWIDASNNHVRDTALCLECGAFAPLSSVELMTDGAL